MIAGGDGAAPQRRELEWLLAELRASLMELKQGLEECYALLAPADQGSTLVVSTPRNEMVKGHITRVGTSIVKGTVYVRLRTMAPQTLTVDADRPIHLASLATLHTLLTHSIDLVTLTLSYSYPVPSPDGGDHGDDGPQVRWQRHPGRSSSSSDHAGFVAAQLRLLSQSIAEAAALLKGPPLTDADPAWTSRSASPACFDPPLPPGLSFHLGLQDSQLVLWLRALEPAGAPVNLGMKFALAIGTARRLDHDEADQVFDFHYDGDSPAPQSGGGEKVYVREKVRVESADPSLLSLGAKLNALSHTLALARRNLAAVIGDELEEYRI